MSDEATPSQFKPGQIWAHCTRISERNSFLTICKVDADPRLGNIVHINIQGLKMKNPFAEDGSTEIISHSPVSEEAVTRSVVSLIRKDASLPDFEDGYAQWREAFDAGEAGIFTLDVAQIVAGMESGLSQHSAA